MSFVLQTRTCVNFSQYVGDEFNSLVHDSTRFPWYARYFSLLPFTFLSRRSVTYVPGLYRAAAPPKRDGDNSYHGEYGMHPLHRPVAFVQPGFIVAS